MKVAHIASEMAPIAKVGGLGDVVYGLAKQQLKTDEPHVILPNYSCIDSKLTSYEGIPLTLLGDYDQIYGGDEILRFAQFCKQAFDFIQPQDFDIIHLHDWPTALLAPMLKMPTVLSIHNVHHQGSCPPALLQNLDLPLDEMQCPNHPGNVNILKGGLIHSDAIVTVSPGYAQEILTPEEGDGLDPTLNKYKSKLCGILNGIDIDYWNPTTDPFLIAPFNSYADKAANKEHLLQSLNMNLAPLICAITRLVPQKGLDMIEQALITSLESNCSFILLGSSPCKETQAHFENLAKTHASPHLHCHFTFNEELAHQVYAAADIIVIPSLFEPCGLTQMIAMRYGAVPVVRKTGGLANTVFDNQNGFTFTEPTPQACKSALKRAIETLTSDPQKWSQLIENGTKSDFSWDKSAAAYRKIYSQLTHQ